MYMKLVQILGVLLVTLSANAAEDLSLPEILTTSSGKKITTSVQWQEARRP